MKRLLLLNILLGTLSIFGQSYFPTLPKTPEMTEMERYGNIPVNLFTGGLDLQIPIFSNGKTNVSLNYNSTGFIPSKKSNYVGYNWSINYGGAITREVRNIPDDLNNDYSTKGFLYTVKNRSMSNSAAYNNGYNYTGLTDYINIDGWYSELNPDKFNFNFLGINGYFYIGNDGKPVISSNTPNLKISLDNFAYQDNFYCAPNLSGFSIIDGEGNEYYFGDNINNMEVSYSLGHHLNPQQQIGLIPSGIGSYSITGWYLYKVKFATGEQLNINYKAKSLYSESDNFCTLRNSLPIKNDFTGSGSGPFNIQPFYELYLSANQANYTNTTIYNGGSGAPFSAAKPHYNIEVIKKVFPQSIEISDKFYINFNYKIQTAAVAENFDAYLLESIEIKNKIQNTLNVEKFDMQYNTSNKDYYFLTGVTKNNIHKYIFDYKLDTTLPKFNTFGVDYWGFWNGAHATNNQLIPNFQLNFSTGDLTITGTSRAPSTGLYDVALLKKITYPAGGYSIFEYEPNYYSQKVTRNSASNFMKQLQASSDYSGGARIKKVTSFDGSTSLNKEYKYTKDFSDSNINGVSSGILYNDYRMVNFRDLIAGSSSSRSISEQASNINSSAMSSYHIGYSEVSELENSQLKKKYFFSDYTTNPDSTVYSRSSQIGYPGINVLPATYQQNYFLRYLDNKDSERGKLVRELFYKDGNNLVQENLNIYSSLKTHNLLANNYTTFIEMPVAWRQLYKFYGLPYVLKKSISRKYFNNTTIEEKATTYYDSNLHLNPTRVVKEYSDNIINETAYTYSNNSLMVNKNMVGIPSGTETKQIKNGVTKTISKVETLYPTSLPNSQTGNLILPLSVRSYDISNLNNTPTTEVTYDKYDSKGNVQQYTTKDGASTGIIWGYGKALPIAKIEGKDAGLFLMMFDMDITILSNASNSDVDASTEEQFRAKLDAFQKRQFYIDVSITTYTHDPLIGVTSITPPSGIREVYLYDTANRLKEIKQEMKNANGSLEYKILKEFNYNYKN